MPRSPTVCRPRLLAGLQLCLVVLGLNASTAQAQIQAPQEVATLLVGVSSAPSVGSLQAVSMLYAGSKPLEVWSLEPAEPPLLPMDVRNQLGACVLVLSGADSCRTIPGIIPQTQTLAWLYLGGKLDYFRLLDTTRVQKIPDLMLNFVRDERDIPNPDDAPLELDTYCAMLRYARHTGADVFLKAAQRDLGYSQLINKPKKFRGDVVLVQGRLRRIEKHDAPLALQLEGVPFIYEGWLFFNGYSSTPICLLFTELPPGAKVGDKLTLEASFAGYYYKKYRYDAVDQRGKQQRRFAPLLIGRMPEIQVVPVKDEDSASDRQLLWIVMGTVIGTVFAVLALTVWFRFQDMRVRQKLALATRREFVLPPPDSEEKIRPDQVTNTALDTTENWKGGAETPPHGAPELNLSPRNRLTDFPSS